MTTRRPTERPDQQHASNDHTTPAAPDAASRPAIDAAITRREFLAVSGMAVALTTAGCAPALITPGRKSYDIILRGGTVFDGTGAAGRELDVALSGGRIAALAPAIRDTARMELDVRGLAVAPGFIDIHSHADGTLFDDPGVESVIRQGITTVVVGQDGSSRAPSRANDRDDDDPPATTVRRYFGRTDAFFKAVEALPSSVNVASMVGLGSVRHVVIGDADRPATAAELQTMVSLVDAALADGACGASSGLEYTPGMFAPREELIALCRPLARRGLPYATHMRNEDDALLDSIDESIAVARGAGCPLQISHLKTQGQRNWGKIDTVLARIEQARRDGLDVAFDRYPYIAYQTTLANLFPGWSRDGGSAAFVARLTDSSLTQRLREAVRAKIELLGDWNNVLISSVASAADRAAEGERLGAYAASLGRDPYDVAVALLTRSHGGVGMVGFAMSEDNLARFLAHPLGMVCSDGGAAALQGPARNGYPHPRSLGTFPRVLARHVRDRRDLTLAQAIYKMTAFPASRVRLADRGRLAAGYAADVVVFDPATIGDRATFADPFQYPVGIRAVLVNGEIALRDDARGARRAGRALRPRSPQAG